jgi:hypothetical protein
MMRSRKGKTYIFNQKYNIFLFHAFLFNFDENLFFFFNKKNDFLSKTLLRS